MSVGNGKRVSVGTVELEVGAVVVHAGGSVVVGAEQIGWGGLVGCISPGFSDLSPGNVSGLQAELDSPSTCPFLLVDC